MDPLTLEQMSNIGELIGASLIIVSLIYVSRQIAQNNRAQRVTAIQLHNDTYHKNLVMLADHSEAWVEGLIRFSELSPAKQIEFAMLIQSVVRHIEQAFMIKNEGLLSESTYNSALALLSNVMSYPGARDWWLTRKETFDVEFAASLDTQMKKNSNADPYGLRDKE
jgi:hypothetical protein